MNRFLPYGWLCPDWPAPFNVHAISTTRSGGVSRSFYESLNLGAHVGDDPATVVENRRRLREEGQLPQEPIWLNQVHGREVLLLDASSVSGIEADGAFTQTPGVVCAVMTADCLPLLLCSRDGTQVAAVHAGWRGLAGGIVEVSIAALGTPTDELLAWMGPAIGPKAFEVGNEVREIFLDLDSGSEEAFTRSDSGRWFADLYGLAHRRLKKCGLDAVFGGGFCTYQEKDRFYSYRRDRTTGRMASLIWLEDNA